MCLLEVDSIADWISGCVSQKVLIIYSWSANEIPWSFIRQLGVEGEVPANCCSPFHWRNTNKSLFVTLLEWRTKALGTFEPLWLCIWRRNCSGMGKAARRAELCVPSIFLQQGLMTTFKARKVINWKASYLFFLLVCLSTMQGWLSYQFLVLLFYWVKVSFNFFFF